MYRFTVGIRRRFHDRFRDSGMGVDSIHDLFVSRFQHLGYCHFSDEL